MDSNLWEKLNSQNWNEIMGRLYAHSISRINWFGLKSQVRVQGKESKDFANEAVTLLFEGTRKWDYYKEPNLVNFLKGVINSLIYNMVKSKERKVFVDKDLTEEINDSLFIDLMFEESLMEKDFIAKLEDSLIKDDEMLLVFKSLIEGLKPSEIQQKYGTSIAVVQNAQKRLRRHVKNITNLYLNP